MLGWHDLDVLMDSFITILYIYAQINVCIKGTHAPTFFFKQMVILVPDVESCLECLMFEEAWRVHSLCSLGEIREKPSWKLEILENVVTTIYKTISNIKHFFFKLFANKIHIWKFSNVDDIGLKSDHICQF